MSTKTLSDIRNTLRRQYVSQVAVNVDREAFANYVRDQMRKGERDWSTHEVARRATGAGFRLSSGTVSNILNCRVKDVSEDKLRALAKVFGVPEAEVFGAYHGTTAADEQVIRNQRLAALAEDAEKLSPEDIPKFEALMDYVHTTVRQMLKERERDSPPKPRRARKVIYGDGTIQAAEKKRA
jgi:transcriptional regulator with XRE-family HTH domain